MKILLTGSSGFIGYHITKKLLENGYEVLGIDNHNDYYDIKIKEDRLNNLLSFDSFKFKNIDIDNRLDLERSFKKFDPQRVVNLAAQPGVRYSLTNPYQYVQSNIVGFVNMIELCRHSKVDGFIYASSSSVYGNNDIFPFSESDKINQPISLYGATKASNELIANSYSHLYGLNTTGLRFFTVYGPWYRPDMAIFIFTKKILKQEKLPLYNQGLLKRDFTFIDDIVEGSYSAIRNNFKKEIFNLGNNKTEKIIKVVKIIENYTGVNAKINHLPHQKGDPNKTYANIDHAKNSLNYKPKITIEEGIPRFIDWYKDYYEI